MARKNAGCRRVLESPGGAGANDYEGLRQAQTARAKPKPCFGKSPKFYRASTVSQSFPEAEFLRHICCDRARMCAFLQTSAQVTIYGTAGFTAAQNCSRRSHPSWSKSLSNRILLLAALARGTTTVTNLLDSDVDRHMLTALRQLDVTYSLSDDRKTCVVKGVSGVFQAKQPLELFLGNAGTAVRPLTAALCISKGNFTITGEPRMYERSHRRFGGRDARFRCGYYLQYSRDDGYPPLVINGKSLAGGEVGIKGNVSSQYLTALLMVAPLLVKENCAALMWTSTIFPTPP